MSHTLTANSQSYPAKSFSPPYKSKNPCDSLSVDHLSEAPENVAPWMKQSLLHEVQIVLSSRQSYVLGGHLTAKETFKLIKYYQEITDVVEQQYGNA